MNWRSLFLFLFALISCFSALGQNHCLTIDDLKSLANLDFESQNYFLKLKGFTYRMETFTGSTNFWNSREWDKPIESTKKYGKYQFVNISVDMDNSCSNVQYRLGVNEECYEEIKKNLVEFGFAMDFRCADSGTKYYGFICSDYGLILTNGGFYTVDIYSIPAYRYVKGNVTEMCGSRW